MNTPNNKRKIMSQEKIKKAFMSLIKNKEISEISVSDIVKLAKINRSTFYANYVDIYDLVDKIKDEMFTNIIKLYDKESSSKHHSDNFLTLFKHIKNNQEYYKLLFKLGFDFSKYYNSFNETNAIKYLGTTEFIDYHIEFFKAGLNAIIKKWIYSGCFENPEEIVEILKNEYKEKSLGN